MTFLSVQHYGILGCLREQYEDLGAACKEEVFKRQAEAANDWRTDKELNEACQVPAHPLSLQPSKVKDARSFPCIAHIAALKECAEQRGVVQIYKSIRTGIC